MNAIAPIVPNIRAYLEFGPAEMAALLGKDAAWLANRRLGIGGSDANILMSGDPDAILKLWEEKTGRAEGEDLSGVLPVIMGTVTEPLNRYWYARQTGRPVTDAGAFRRHPRHEFMATNLDGLTTAKDGQRAVLECKQVNAFAKIEEVEQKYMPQVHHNMTVLGCERSILSVFIGTLTWAYTEIALDEWYLAELMDRERAFWDCVQSDTPPPVMNPVEAPAPIKISDWRTVDMTGNNEFAASAADWLANQAAVKKFKKAETDLKALVEPDVERAHGYGIEIKRSKAGALSIKELKEKKEKK